MTVLYKLTRADCTTGTDDRRLLWGPGVTHRATGKGVRLCTSGVIHAYAHPLQAALFYPAHVTFLNPRLWRCEGDIATNDGAKVGVKALTVIEEVPLPQVSMAARVRWAILCAMQAYDDDDWRQWAEAWLAGKDRCEASAVRAVEGARAAVEVAAKAAALEPSAVTSALEAEAAASAAGAALALAVEAGEAVTMWASAAAVVTAAVSVAVGKKRPLELMALAEQAMKAEQ